MNKSTIEHRSLMPTKTNYCRTLSSRFATWRWLLGDRLQLNCIFSGTAQAVRCSETGGLAPFRSYSVLKVICKRTLLCLFVLLGSDHNLASETIVIPLNEGVKRDPVVQWVGPRRAEAVSFTSNGIAIDHTAADTNTTGVKSRFSIAGDFDIEFDCTIRKLDPPKSGDRQGLTLRFLFDGPEEKNLTFGYVASAKHKKGFYINPSGMLGQKVVRHVSPNAENIQCRFQRIGDEVQYTFIPDGGTPIKGAVKVLSRDVRDFAVFATRQDADNTDGSYVIKKLQVTADNFPTYTRNVPPNVVSWWTIFVGTQVTVLVVLLGVAFVRQQAKRS